MKFVKTQNYLKMMKMAKVFDAAPFKTDREMAVPAVRTHDEPLQRYDFEVDDQETARPSKDKASLAAAEEWYLQHALADDPLPQAAFEKFYSSERSLLC